ncbi:hypothetical protein D3C71_1998980 [compost metagenome]
MSAIVLHASYTPVLKRGAAVCFKRAYAASAPIVATRTFTSTPAAVSNEFGFFCVSTIKLAWMLDSEAFASNSSANEAHSW